MKTLLLAVLLAALALQAPEKDNLEGLWQGYAGEWVHVSKQLVALAEAFPAEKLAWRPAPGVRSASEVFMHIAITNFGLLSFTGPKVKLSRPKLAMAMCMNTSLADRTPGAGRHASFSAGNASASATSCLETW